MRNIQRLRQSGLSKHLTLVSGMVLQGVVSMTSFMVVCAVLASIAVGILLAHGLCVAMFAMFRNHQRQVHAARALKPQVARLKTLNS